MPDEQPRSPFSRPPSRPAAVVESPAPHVIPAPPAPATPPGGQSLRGGQSLPMGLIAGLAAAAVGAAVWAVVTVVTGYQIGWMAVAVGFLVGWAVRLAGKGNSSAFGMLGAALALGGCLVGNLLTGSVVASRELGVPITEVLARMTPTFGFDLMAAMFSPIDLLFYGLAIYQGYRFSMAGAPAEA